MAPRWVVVVRGDRAAIEAAVARLHVLTEVRGVLEEDGVWRVWVDPIAGGLPAFAGVTVELAPDDEDRWTGLEADAPIEIESDLCVRPPWVASPPGFAGVELVVPRGGAFGSGEHDSTKAALSCLHATWPEPPPATALDVGTGSGILALYAHTRGVRRVFACDVDPAAVAAAASLLATADVRVGGPEVFDLRADLVIANLSGSELAAALDAIGARWNGRSPLVLGGMTGRELERLRPRLPGSVAAAVTRGRFTAVALRTQLLR